uniref:G_PROTEIN_RECEP_F1_2 domain-containing protein n=1 Tax=Heterorhabditis bacteriophora TaxID=37862 RepID=A0A1I7WW17_HETBA
MGFGSNWLEAAFGRWSLGARRHAVRSILNIIAASAFVRCLAHAPDITAARAAALALGALILHLLILVRPEKVRLAQLGTIILLIVDSLMAMPGHDSLFPSIVATFAIYTLIALPFYTVLGSMIALSVIQTCTFVLFVQPLKTNELSIIMCNKMYIILATIIIHVWFHFIGIYLHMTADRLSRSTFLSGRNAVEAESAAEQQSLRLTKLAWSSASVNAIRTSSLCRFICRCFVRIGALDVGASNRNNRLLSSFLPPHLISLARHQISLYAPYIYAEHYDQVTVAYGRLIGFEAVLAQCSSLDAARVLKVKSHLCEHFYLVFLFLQKLIFKKYSLVYFVKNPLITSLALIVIALTLMFFILLMLYINYFHVSYLFFHFCKLMRQTIRIETEFITMKSHFLQSFSQFITRTSPGHSVTILLIMAILFLCGIVNTIEIKSMMLIFFTHPPIGPKQFVTEFDLFCGLVSLSALVFIHSRRCEKLMRLDFLSVVKVSSSGSWSLKYLITFSFIGKRYI